VVHFLNFQVNHWSSMCLNEDRSSVADPARKFMGGRFQEYLAVKCLSELYTTMVKKITFVGFRGGDRPLLDPPLQVISSLS